MRCGLKNREKAQIYFAIACFILGSYLEISFFIAVSAGLFLGSSVFFFFNIEE